MPRISRREPPTKLAQVRDVTCGPGAAHCVSVRTVLGQTRRTVCIVPAAFDCLLQWSTCVGCHARTQAANLREGPGESIGELIICIKAAASEYLLQYSTCLARSLSTDWTFTVAEEPPWPLQMIDPTTRRGRSDGVSRRTASAARRVGRCCALGLARVEEARERGRSTHVGPTGSANVTLARLTIVFSLGGGDPA